MRWLSFCLRRWTFLRSRARIRTTGEEEIRKPDDEEPFAALVFKIMTDPFVGQLAFIRVYSGALKSGDSVYNPRKQRSRAHRAPAAHARQQARGDYGSSRRRHLRLRRSEERDHRRHHLRRKARRSCWRSIEFPDPVITLRWNRRPRATRKRWALRSASWRRKIRPSGCTPTRTAGRRSSAAWASCTWKSSSTA